MSLNNYNINSNSHEKYTSSAIFYFYFFVDKAYFYGICCFTEGPCVDSKKRFLHCASLHLGLSSMPRCGFNKYHWTFCAYTRYLWLRDQIRKNELNIGSCFPFVQYNPTHKRLKFWGSTWILGFGIQFQLL